METENAKSIRRIIGSQVRHHRTDRNWTQNQLAEKADLSLDMIGRLERGTASPSLDSLIRLAGVLGVSPVVLLGGSPLDGQGEMEREQKLQKILVTLGEVETSDLDWIEGVLHSVIRR